MVAKRILIGGLVLLIGAAMLGGCSGTATSPSTDVGSCVTTNDRAVGCNQVGGYSGNEVTSGLVGATISGGGDQSLRNRIVGDFGTGGGGQDNTAGGRAAGGRGGGPGRAR